MGTLLLGCAFALVVATAALAASCLRLRSAVGFLLAVYVLATAEIYDRMEAVSTLDVPNVALAEYKAPDNYPAGDCPLCRAGVAVTTF